MSEHYRHTGILERANQGVPESKLAPAGYKLADVPKVRCLMCEEPIGDGEYREQTSLARFGQMLFVHVECPTSARDQKDRTTNG